MYESEQRERGRHVLQISRISGAGNFYESCFISDTNASKLQMRCTSVARGLKKPEAERGGHCVILIQWLQVKRLASDTAG